MTALQCLNCQAEISNGLALCELCQRWARSALEYLPVYLRNLARWKPGRAGSRPVPGSRALYDGPSVASGDRVALALDEATNALTTWARAVEDDRGVQAPTADGEIEQAAIVAEWLSDHLTTIATLEWGGEFMRELDQHERRLRMLTEQVAPGWYGGECRGCSTPTHVIPGLTWVTCGGCGRTTYARDHINTVLTEARQWVARPMRLAEAIVALIDTEHSASRLHKRISKWGEREQIETLRQVDRDGDEVGPKQFRLGDVLDRLADEGSTRSETAASERIQA